jgi:hypothetical protein
MPFEIPWDEATPPGTAPANTVATELRNLEKAIRERLESAFGITNWATQTDPIEINSLRFDASGKIIGGSVSVAVRNNADTENNLLVEDDGDVTVRKDLAVNGKILTVTFTGDVTIESGESVLIQSEIQVSSAQGWVSRHDLGSVSGAVTVDWALGNNKALTLTGNSTLTFNNPKAGAVYLLEVKQGGAGSFTLGYPGTVVWPSGGAPVLTTTAGRTDLLSFYYTGTAYIGLVAAQDFNV